MEENNGKGAAEAVKTYTKEEVVEFINRALNEQQNNYSWVVSKVNWMMDIVKNQNLFNDSIVEKSEKELEGFLFPTQPENKSNNDSTEV